MKKKLLSILLVLVMIFSVSGCEKKELSASDLLEKAYENCESVKNITAKQTMQLSASAAGESINLNIDSDIVAFSDPYKVKMEANMDMGELGSQAITMYMAEEDGKYYTYTGASGMWMKQSMDKAAFDEAMNSYDSKAYLEQLVDNTSTFTFNETTEDDKEVYKLDGNITGESLKNMLKTANSMSQLDSLGIDYTQAFDSISDLPVTIYIEKESGNLYKMSMDMSDFMKQVMSSMSDAAGTDESLNTDVAIDKCDMAITYTGYDNAENFDIPEEALNAEEIDLNALSGLDMDDETSDETDTQE